MRWVRFQYLPSRLLLLNPATQTAKHLTAASMPSSIISTKALTKSAQRLSSATVATIEGEIVSVDQEEDVFLNGIEVLTGSRRSSTATNSHHAKPATGGKHRPATSTAAPPLPSTPHGHNTSKPSHKPRPLPSTTASPDHSSYSVCQAGFGKPIKSAEKSSMVAATVAAISSMQFTLSPPNIAAGGTAMGSKSSSLSHSSRIIAAVAGHSSSAKAIAPISKSASSTHHSPATSTVAGHSSSTNAVIS